MFSVEFSKGDTFRLSRRLKTLDRDVDDVMGTMHQNALNYFIQRFNLYLNRVPYDGNDKGDINYDTPRLVGNHYTRTHLEWLGDDIQYIEYGYGARGKDSPHPNREIDWEYSEREEWVYFDKNKGQFRFSRGQEGTFAPFYRTVKDTEGMIRAEISNGRYVTAFKDLMK